MSMQTSSSLPFARSADVFPAHQKLAPFPNRCIRVAHRDDAPLDYRNFPRPARFSEILGIEPMLLRLESIWLQHPLIDKPLWCFLLQVGCWIEIVLARLSIKPFPTKQEVANGLAFMPCNEVHALSFRPYSKSLRVMPGEIFGGKDRLQDRQFVLSSRAYADWKRGFIHSTIVSSSVTDSLTIWKLSRFLFASRRKAIFYGRRDIFVDPGSRRKDGAKPFSGSGWRCRASGHLFSGIGIYVRYASLLLRPEYA